MDFFELIGFIIGDGNIYHNPKHHIWRLEIAGNVVEDYDYFLQIRDFLVENAQKKPQFFTRNHKNGKSLRIMLYDKEFINRLLPYGLPIGKKTFTITIPIIDDNKMVSLVRGLFEADGCLYFSKSKDSIYPTYPRLEIKTSSIALLEQLRTYLIRQGFNVYTRKSKSDRTFAIGVSGNVFLEKWRKLFGFNSLKNKTKYGFWKSRGFYIPYTPLEKRIQYAHVA